MSIGSGVSRVDSEPVCGNPMHLRRRRSSHLKVGRPRAPQAELQGADHGESRGVPSTQPQPRRPPRRRPSEGDQPRGVGRQPVRQDHHHYARYRHDAAQPARAHQLIEPADLPADDMFLDFTVTIEKPPAARRRHWAPDAVDPVEHADGCAAQRQPHAVSAAGRRLPASATHPPRACRQSEPGRRPAPAVPRHGYAQPVTNRPGGCRRGVRRGQARMVLKSRKFFFSEGDRHRRLTSASARDCLRDSPPAPGTRRPPIAQAIREFNI